MEAQTDSMLVQSIFLAKLPEKSEKFSLIFFAYSISGILNENLDISVYDAILLLCQYLSTKLDFASRFREFHSVSEEV